MKSLIVGMGIGQLYKSVLTNLGHEIVTVDLDIRKGAMLPSVKSAILSYGTFDTVHICTPNFTHELLARTVAPYAKIVFVEKPGFASAEAWTTLVHDYPKTRFMMVKNNQWRADMPKLIAYANASDEIKINWINNDRVPNPGTWFTTKELSYGGVSRDLMPHLLSLFMVLEPNYATSSITATSGGRRWTLPELTSTQYGAVKADGTYDVDDYSRIEFTYNNKVWKLTADWRSMTGDKRNIKFTNKGGLDAYYELGLCPEEAYQTMIVDCIKNVDMDDFWDRQNIQDTWIHKIIGQL